MSTSLPPGALRSLPTVRTNVVVMLLLPARPETALGAHGGSGLSALGGVIRLHEIGPDAPPIRHALKLELFAHQYYYGGGKEKRKLQKPVR
jgi:hypothetical protein